VWLILIKLKKKEENVKKNNIKTNNLVNKTKNKFLKTPPTNKNK